MAKIKSHIKQMFWLARADFDDVHDSDLRKWALQKNEVRLIFHLVFLICSQF